jgi:SOS response regulatory protein OraA/RecX
MEKTTAKSETTRALDLLSRLLALRDHSVYELRTKLSRRFPTEIVVQVLQQAEECGWLINEQLISERAVDSLQRRFKSRGYIEDQLRKRQLPLPKIDETLELENARTLVQKKFGDSRDLSYDERAKAFRYLRNRGFNDQVIGMVFHAEP